MNLLQGQTEGRVVASSVTDTKMKPKRRGRKREYVPRRTRKFQLRTNHPQDIHVREILDYARQNKREVTLIRDAVQLQYSLEQGDISLLLERFPFIAAMLRPPPPTDDNLKDDIAELKRLILEQGVASFPPMRPNEVAMQSTGAGLRKLDAPTFTLPVFDDDDEPTLVLSTSTKNDASKNFLRGLSGLH